MTGFVLPPAPKSPAPPWFSLIVASDQHGGIGRDGDLAWHLPPDLKWFRRVTVGAGGQGVIMGRKTWDSIPQRFRPLPDRQNLVLTRQPKLELPECVLQAHSLDSALESLDSSSANFVIGGGAIYRQALQHPRCKRVYLTEVDGSFDCDTFLPAWGAEWSERTVLSTGEANDIRFQFVQLDRTDLK